jgi:neutral amino acid transport system substrate-binding protein
LIAVNDSWFAVHLVESIATPLLPTEDMTEYANRKPCLFARIAVFLTVGSLLTACQLPEGLINFQATEEDPVAVEDPIEEAPGLKIGAVLPYTGESARTGQAMIEVLPLLVDQVNACGGVLDQSVSLVVEDDQSQPQLAAAALRKLVEVDQVDVAIVGFVNGASPEILDIAIQNNVPVVSPGTTSPAFTEYARAGRFNGFWARTVPSDVHRAAALAKMAIDRRYRNVSLVVVDSDDGISFEQAFTAHFEKLGGTVLNKEFPNRYDPQDTFLNTEALNAFYPPGGTPDAVVAALDPQGGALLLRTADELGATSAAQIVLATNFQPRSFLERVGRNYEGKYILSGSLGISPGAAGLSLDTLTNLWKQREGRSNPGAFVPQTWDALALLLLAAQAANSTDGEAIRDQMRLVANAPGLEVTNICTGLKMVASGQDIDYQGASGNVNLDEHGDVVGSYDIWSVNEQGKVEVINQIRLER